MSLNKNQSWNSLMLQKGRGRGRLAIGLVFNLEEGNINKMKRKEKKS